METKYNNRIPYIITCGIRPSIKQKLKLYDTYLKNPTDKANYKIHRNKLTSLLRIVERTFHEEQLEIDQAMETYRISYLLFFSYLCDLIPSQTGIATL